MTRSHACSDGDADAYVCGMRCVICCWSCCCGGGACRATVAFSPVIVSVTAILSACHVIWTENVFSRILTETGAL